MDKNKANGVMKGVGAGKNMNSTRPGSDRVGRKFGSRQQERGGSYLPESGGGSGKKKSTNSAFFDSMPVYKESEHNNIRDEEDDGEGENVVLGEQENHGLPGTYALGASSIEVLGGVGAASHNLSPERAPSKKLSRARPAPGGTAILYDRFGIVSADQVRLSGLSSEKV